MSSPTRWKTSLFQAVSFDWEVENCHIQGKKNTVNRTYINTSTHIFRPNIRHGILIGTPAEVHPLLSLVVTRISTEPADVLTMIFIIWYKSAFFK